MTIERTSKEVLIRFPISSQMDGLQDFIDYLRYKELTSGFGVEQQQVDKLAKEINTSWWQKNKSKFVS